MKSIVCHVDEHGVNRFYEEFRELAPPTPDEVQVEIMAISINPVDCKIMSGPAISANNSRILGWDAVGKIVQTGKNVTDYKAGDKVWYAGDITKDGCYASHQNIDAKIISLAPRTISSAEAAALPLTGITAFESLVEKLGYNPSEQKENSSYSLLIINGAGGVGSIAIQLANLFGIHVTATASRQESQAWCYDLGADNVISHKSLSSLPDNSFDRILCCHDTDLYFDLMCKLISPQGRICALSSAKEKHNIQNLMQKSATFAWEFMFTKSMFQTQDLNSQHRILERLKELVEQKKLKTTMTQLFKGIDVESLHKAHERQKQSSIIGKQVLQSVSIEPGN